MAIRVKIEAKIFGNCLAAWSTIPRVNLSPIDQPTIA